MKQSIKFYLDQAGVQEVIYHGVGISELERQTIEKELSQVSAAFVSQYGTDGAFTVEFIRSKVNHPKAPAGATRPTYRIKAADAKTGAILKAHPRWLDQFNKGARL